MGHVRVWRCGPCEGVEVWGVKAVTEIRGQALLTVLVPHEGLDDEDDQHDDNQEEEEDDEDQPDPKDGEVAKHTKPLAVDADAEPNISHWEGTKESIYAEGERGKVMGGGWGVGGKRHTC